LAWCDALCGGQSACDTAVVARRAGLDKRRWTVERANAWLVENKRLALR